MSAAAHPELNGDWHVHSQFSDDATSTMAENIRVAVERGVRHLRLIDHVRVSTTWVPEFLAAIALERRSLPDSLTLHTGVEAKILDSSGALDIPSDLVIGVGGVDGIVIADHQFPGQDGPWTPERTRAELASGLSTTDALATLVHATIGAMKLAPGGQLAHPFSILPKIGLGEDDLDGDLLAEWADAAAATGTSIEVNEKWACPGARVIRAARAAGARVVAATDSHVAEDVGRYDRVIALLDAAAGESV
ncbi:MULTISPECIES: PHP domain-containing protein [unclassified Leifsonia]|uniref:PHP domain-containing protein n=1 Tax=unclassified Leifsonia TaxID=2663824 RepID=UPI0006FA2FFB|nr:MULTISPECIES: PHP domain-containing protein [unclassified Leifsonia]KQX07369.1 histidinol phosphatase [Leifsonia sp. Root1293]KRA11651.1 histidinol phosphatase [Leifsonia sp. Root60]